MQLRPRFCNGIGQGVRGPDVYGVIGRMSARVDMADWTLRAFDRSAYRNLVSHEEKNARGVTCVAQRTQRSRTERRSVRARFPPRRRGRSLVPMLREVGMDGLRPRRLLDRGGKLRGCAWIQ